VEEDDDEEDEDDDEEPEKITKNFNDYLLDPYVQKHLKVIYKSALE